MTTTVDLTPEELIAAEALVLERLDALVGPAVAGLTLLTGRALVTREEDGSPRLSPDLSDLIRELSRTPVLAVTRNDGSNPVEVLHVHVTSSGAATLQTLPTRVVRLTEYATDEVDALLTEIIGAATAGVSRDGAGDALVATASLSEAGGAVAIQWPEPFRDPVVLTVAAPWRESAVTWVADGGRAWIVTSDADPTDLELTPTSRGVLSEVVTQVIADLFTPTST